MQLFWLLGSFYNTQALLAAGKGKAVAEACGLRKGSQTRAQLKREMTGQGCQKRMW